MFWQYFPFLFGLQLHKPFTWWHDLVLFRKQRQFDAHFNLYVQDGHRFSHLDIYTRNINRRTRKLNKEIFNFFSFLQKCYHRNQLNFALLIYKKNSVKLKHKQLVTINCVRYGKNCNLNKFHSICIHYSDWLRENQN